MSKLKDLNYSHFFVIKFYLMTKLLKIKLINIQIIIIAITILFDNICNSFGIYLNWFSIISYIRIIIDVTINIKRGIDRIL